MYRLLNAQGQEYLSPTKGAFGGHRGTKRYGLMNCPAARRALAAPTAATYKKNRVFFADEATALAAGYQPCGRCLPKEREIWKTAQQSREL